MLNQLKPDPLRSPLLEKAKAQGIRHGYFTRIGGVSEGIYQGLNIGTGSADDQTSVQENRRRVAQWMGVPANHLLTAYQIHSPDVIVAREPFTGERPKADAIVTDRPGIAVGASTADCGPVLFTDSETRVIGAAHAGWRGLADGVLEALIGALPVAADRLTAWLGPAIGPASFEVGAEVRTRFCDEDAAAADAFAAGAPGKYFADLYRLARRRLARSGVARVSGGGEDTMADPFAWYSYRRDTRCGRMASLVWLSEHG